MPSRTARPSTDVPGFDPTAYFFLRSGKVVSTELISERDIDRDGGTDGLRKKTAGLPPEGISLRNYEDAVNHLCEVLNDLDDVLDFDDVRTPIETSDFIPMFESANYFGVYCYHADRYYDGENEYYLVDKTTGEHKMVLGDSFAFIGQNLLDCMKDEEILHVANRQWMQYLVDYSLRNVKGIVPEEELRGIMKLQAALKEADADRAVSGDKEAQKENSSVLQESEPGRGATLEDRIAWLKARAREFGGELLVESQDFYSEKHLSCFWYDSGEVAEFLYKGFICSIEVQGDVALSVWDEEHENIILEYRKPATGGAYVHPGARAVIKDDATLDKLEDDDRVEWSNNNWVELRVFDRDGKECPVDIVMEDDLLGAMSHFKCFVREVDAIRKKQEMRIQNGNRREGEQSEGPAAVENAEYSQKNTKINYLYRDADNYKVHNECVINGVLTGAQKAVILECLDDGEYFIPSLVGLPEVRFDEEDPAVDHQWFVLREEDFEETTERSTTYMTPDELVAAFCKCKDRWMDVYLGLADKPGLEEKILSAQERVASTDSVVPQMAQGRDI